MILGIGIDLVDLDKIKSMMNERFIERVLSLEEQKIFNNIQNDDKKLSFLGGRFAAKEAIFKAVSKGDGKARYIEFSILNDDNGKPYVVSHHFDQKVKVHLSITHTDHHAMCYCLLENND